MDNWELKDEGATLLHFWNGSTKLCDSVKNPMIYQEPPPIRRADHCTVCKMLMQKIINTN